MVFLGNELTTARLRYLKGSGFKLWPHALIAAQPSNVRRPIDMEFRVASCAFGSVWAYSISALNTCCPTVLRLEGKSRF
jgi:hypothetical protein